MSQIALPFPPPRRRSRHMESDAFWRQVVVPLRKSGHRVYRAGRFFKVDGSYVTGQVLRLLATHLARPS